MKQLAGLVVMLTLAASPCWAQTPGAADKELIAIENDWSQAAIARDATALQRFYADEYVFTNEDGVVTNKATEIANIRGGTFRLTSYKFDDLKVHVYGEVAVVTGRNTIKGFWDDIKRDVSGPYRFTDVFVKRNGRWQCVASQSSRITEK